MHMSRCTCRAGHIIRSTLPISRPPIISILGSGDRANKQGVQGSPPLNCRSSLQSMTPLERCTLSLWQKPVAKLYAAGRLGYASTSIAGTPYQHCINSLEPFVVNDTSERVCMSAMGWLKVRQWLQAIPVRSEQSVTRV